MSYNINIFDRIYYFANNNFIDLLIDIDLSNPTGGAIIDSTKATITIVDNDDLPSLAISDVTIDEDNTTAVFTVTLSAASGLDVEVAYAIPADCGCAVYATSIDDYTPVTGTLTILAGNLTGTISVAVLEDALVSII